MIDGRFDQHFLELFAGRDGGPSSVRRRVALAVFLGLLALTGGVFLS
jgi:hypothetical protein